MDNQKLKQACLLELSGELAPAARKAFIDEISSDPAACYEYEKVRAGYILLSMLPIPEPSAEQRFRIPAEIKRALHRTLLGPAKKASDGHLLLRGAVAALIVVMVGFFAWKSWSDNQAENRHASEQFARVLAATDRIAQPGTKPSAYDLAMTDVEASIRQLETESPTLSNVYDKNLANLLDALAKVPQAYATGDWVGE